jgi:copper(I)-binding protein
VTSRPAPRLLAVAGIVLALALGGCGDGGSQPAAEQASAVSVSDAWVKAADGGMTAAFAELTNDGPTAATLVAATTDVSSTVEIHQTTMVDGAMAMAPADGGIVIPAGGSVTLEPGGYHIMLMDVVTPVEPGEKVALTLEFSDGSTADVTAIGKQFSGGNEEYTPSGE